MDEGDIADLKSVLFLENFVMTGKMKQIGVLAKNLYALEVQDACKALSSKETDGDLVVEREGILPLNMQSQKKSQTIVEKPQFVQQLQEVVEQPQEGKLSGDQVETSTHVETSSRGKHRARCAEGSHVAIPPRRRWGDIE